MNPEWLEALSVEWFDTKLAVEVLPLLIEGTGITLYVTVTAWMLAMVIGFPLLLLRRTRIRLISRPIGFLVEFIRSTPILVQIYFFFFVLPDLGLVLSPVATGIFAMTLHYGCYMSEVYRSGLESIHHGQWDAVTALGFSRIDTYRYVILPQIVPPLVPASGNFLVFMMKDSPLLASIGATELMFIRQWDRYGHLPVPGADHHVRPDLPGAQPRGRRRDTLCRGQGRPRLARKGPWPCLACPLIPSSPSAPSPSGSASSWCSTSSTSRSGATSTWR